jgi:hypothetical protein
MKYKNTYRVLPELDNELSDIPRLITGEVDPSYDDIYLSCANNVKVYHFSRDVLTVYIPSLKRGHNIVKAIEEKDVPYTNYIETDEEVIFHIKAKNIDDIANILKIRTSGSSISPFSTRNLPRAKVEIPLDEIEEYKKIVSRVNKSNLLLIKDINNAFLTSVLEKKYKEDDKSFDYKTDMKKLKLARQTKEYIWTKNLFSEYLDYMDKEITKFYNK